jgi:hypothetical protein
METNPSGNSPLIDIGVLTKVVRSMLASETAEIKTWHLAQIGGGMGNPVSVGLFRVQGVASDQGMDEFWSVILKVLQSPENVGWKDMGESDDPSHWNYWKREPLVYRSGLLDNLPEGLAAPCCYAVEELPGNVSRLWLEDIQDMYQSAWTLERYSLTARHLGRLNGKYINKNNYPEYPWLGRELNRQWLQMFDWKNLQWGHPAALSRYPEPDNNPFLQLLLQHERLLEKLDMLPKTISHGDTYPTNFMSRIDIKGREQTVALDWALLGLQPLGYDLGQFVFGAITNLKEVIQIEVIDSLFEAYFQGLRDEGCNLDAKSVRFGFAVSAALRVGLFQVFLLSNAIEQSNADIKSEDSSNIPDAFEVVMAREAFRLIDQ